MAEQFKEAPGPRPEKEPFYVKEPPFVSNFPDGTSDWEIIRKNIQFKLSRVEVPLIEKPRALTPETKELIQASLHTGDIVLVGGETTIGGLYIGGHYTHILLYTGEGQCIHVTGHGTSMVPMDLILKKFPKIALIRPSEDADLIDRAVQHAKARLRMPYNFNSNRPSADTIYCTELVGDAYKHVGIDMPSPGPVRKTILHRILKGTAIHPEDFFGFGETVFASHTPET